jgi:phosphoribosylaminoimidazolecarboxamide formyltransferase/IMP cyclohydrolase
MTQKQRALISVSDKTGIVAFAQSLQERDWEIISTGGTAWALTEAGLEVHDVADITGFPEMMDGRLKTLHPKVHGGLLGRAGIDDEVMQRHGITPISLLVVNLYPFQATIEKPGCTLETAIENIDIGGPAMLRAAAKNWRRVGALCDPRDYSRVLDDLVANGGVLSESLRFTLLRKVFAHTAHYDHVISDFLSQVAASKLVPAA